MLKRTISLFAAAVLTLGLAGCNMVIKDEEKASWWRRWEKRR